MIQVTDVEGQEHLLANHLVTMVSPDDRRPDLTVVKMACGTAIRLKMTPDEFMTAHMSNGVVT